MISTKVTWKAKKCLTPTSKVQSGLSRDIHDESP
jgi:hypothetical protein